jgi:uncharacterized protein YndB with AHSA1/START domain
VKHDFLYSVEGEYPVSIERLWSAWADSAQLEQWYHPTDLEVLPGSASSTPTVGGLWTVAIDVPQFEMVAYFFGWYSKVEPLKRLEHTMAYTQDALEFQLQDENAPHHKVVIEFEDRGDKSWVKFSQFGEMPAEQIEATTVGMQSYFASLRNFLA